MTSRSLAFVRHTILLLPLGASSFLEHHSHYYELGKNSTSDILGAGAVTHRSFYLNLGMYFGDSVCIWRYHLVNLKSQM